MPQDFSFDEPNAQRRYRPPDFSTERERDDPFAPPRRRLETIEPPEASEPSFSAELPKEVTDPFPSAAAPS